MHPFDADFYGHEMKAIVLGYIRPELDYTTRGVCFLNCDPASPCSHLPFLINHPSLTLTKLFPFSQMTSLRILRPTSALLSGPSCDQLIRSSRKTYTLISPPSMRSALEYMDQGKNIPSLFDLHLHPRVLDDIRFKWCMVLIPVCIAA